MQECLWRIWAGPVLLQWGVCKSIDMPPILLFQHLQESLPQGLQLCFWWWHKHFYMQGLWVCHHLLSQCQWVTQLSPILTFSASSFSLLEWMEGLQNPAESGVSAMCQSVSSLVFLLRMLSVMQDEEVEWSTSRSIISRAEQWRDRGDGFLFKHHPTLFIVNPSPPPPFTIISTPDGFVACFHELILYAVK